MNSSKYSSNLLPKNQHGCPTLILAPMEGVGDRTFRKGMSSIGGFDLAVRDFIRVPRCAHVQSLSLAYQDNEMHPIPLVAQLMGSELDLMAAMAQEIEKRGAPRIDINCGCPSQTVTGKGAGSSLLKDPSFLHEVAKAVVQAVNIPVSLKMRSGYEDTTLFHENLKAAEESGICYLTLHPRTKVDGYGPPARWDLIADAKSRLKIPLVGNGDILTVEHALNMLKQTKCDALMIGRGSLINPFIFQQIKAHFAQEPYILNWEELKKYFFCYLEAIPLDMAEKTKVNKVKQLMSYFFKGSPELLERRQNILSAQYTEAGAYLTYALEEALISLKSQPFQYENCSNLP